MYIRTEHHLRILPEIISSLLTILQMLWHAPEIGQIMVQIVGVSQRSMKLGY